MSSKSQRLARRRLELFREQWALCWWCHEVCDMPVRGPKHKPRPRDATLDHLFDRFDPARTDECRGERRYVMACWQCNHDRGLERMRAQPIEEIRRRSRRLGEGNSERAP